ncbi:unnamed protein product [Cochlearia groenlandica]
MNLPQSAMTPTSATSTSSSSDTAAENSTERCEGCRSHDAFVIHTVRRHATLQRLCTHCLLRNHPASFCPTCFTFYDSSPPHPSRRVSCSNCLSLTHTHCASDEESSSYRCPPCRNPSSFSFFRPIIGSNGGRFVDKSLSEAFLCAARIAASSMNKAVSAAKCVAELRGKEAATVRKRLREALEEAIMLDDKDKTRCVVPKLRESSVEFLDQKPKLYQESYGTAKESSVITSNGSTEKQSLALPAAKVKQEGDA